MSVVLDRCLRAARRSRSRVVGCKRADCSPIRSPARGPVNLYSLVETCKANNVEPLRYLVWLFATLPLATTVDGYAALMRWVMPRRPRTPRGVV